MHRSARASRSLVGPHWFTHTPPTGPYEVLALHKLPLVLAPLRERPLEVWQGFSELFCGSVRCEACLIWSPAWQCGGGTVVGPRSVAILSVPVSTKFSGAAEASDVSVGLVGIALLGAMMNSTTSKCLPKMLSSSSNLAAGVEERSPPTGSDFSVQSTEGFRASNAVKRASAMALHMSDGYAARDSVL